MTEENIQELFRNKGKSIPPEPRRFSDIRKKVANTDDSALKELINVPYKSVVATVLFSIFLWNFGVARFYLGDVKGGLKRLFTVVGSNVLSFLLLLIPALGVYIYSAVNIIFSIAFFLWWLFDIVACLDEAREHNYWRLVTKIDRLNRAGIEAIADSVKKA